MNSISLNELLNKKNDSIIIDIRSKYEYKKYHIEGSINICYEVLITNVTKYLNPLKTYYIVCNSGKLSLKTCFYLRSLGYKVINVKDGIN